MGRRSNGEGTVYKRKDGRWCSAYFDEQFERRYVYGKTQAEVKKKLRELQASKTVKSKPYTLGAWVKEFMEKYKKNDLKITTYSSYMQICRRHIFESKLGKMRLDRVKTTDLQQFYNGKLEEGYTSKYVRSIEVIINSALEKAVSVKIISDNPNLYTVMPKKERYEGKMLSRQEVEKIVRDAKDEELYPIIVTTVYTGLRKGEVMALKWENIDFVNRQIHVKGSLCRVVDETPDENGVRHTTYQILEPKTKKSIRPIPMLEVVYEALMIQKKRQDSEKKNNKWFYEDQDLVFANPQGGYIAQRKFMNRYHDFLKRYGITDIRFHDLRHTFASLLIEADVSIKVIQELLGHSTITTSMDIYAHVSDRKKEEAMEQLQIGKIG